MTQPTFARGDVVQLKTGHTKMEVVRVLGDEIQTRYPRRFLDEPWRQAKDFILVHAYGSKSTSPKT